MEMLISCADCKLKKELKVADTGYVYIYTCVFDNVGPVLFNGTAPGNYNYTMDRHPRCPLKEEENK